MRKSMSTMFLILIVIFIGSAAYAGEDKGAQEDFVSGTLSNVFNRFGDYVSGERDPLKDYNDEENIIMYDNTGLTRGVSNPPPRVKRNLPEDNSAADPTINIHGSTSQKD